jgi:predicted permease
MSIDRWLRIVPLRLRSLFRRPQVEQELDEELRYHVERQANEYVRRGLPPEEARALAQRELGNVAYYKEEVRDMRGTRWIEEIVGDVRFALRSLGRSRGFSAAVIVTLALGIGVNTAMFTLLRGTLLRPLPNRNGDRLVYLRQSAPAAHQDNAAFSVPEVQDYRVASKTLAAFAEYSSGVPFTLVGRDNQPMRVKVGVVTGNFFTVMGLDAVLGRLTNPGDDGPAAASVAVLSFEFWNTHFGGDPKVLGSTIKLNDKLTTVVGVAQPSPPYPAPTDVFVNTVTSPHNLSATMVTGRTHRMSELFARLAPGATVEQAQTEVGQIAERMFRDHPEAYDKASRFQVTVRPLKAAEDARASLTFWLLMGAASFVLLIACANVANLTLMRGVGREREMHVRAALGAGVLRLRRLLIVENLLLAVAGGAVGILVALAGLRMLVGFAAQLSPRANEIRVDGLVLAACLATSVAAAIILSFVPRIGGKRSLAASIVGGGRRATLGKSGQRFQRSLVVAQLAVCMVLLTGAGLLVRTLGKLQSVDTGMHADQALLAELPVDGSFEEAVAHSPELVNRYDRMRDAVAALPGVRRASLVSATPLERPLGGLDVKAEGRTVPPDRPMPNAAWKTIDTSYFGALSIPLVAGRNFRTSDDARAPHVVILNESFAKQLFGDENPIGRRVAWTGDVLRFTPFTGDWRTVVGVVGDTKDLGLEQGAAPTMYEPFAQEVILGATLVVRGSGDVELLKPAVARAVHDVYPRQLIDAVQTLGQLREATVTPQKLNALFIAAFGTLALAIAMVGIAGVLGFSVSARTAEIGIRMSLGANESRIRAMVLGEGGRLLVIGLLLGVIGALATTRLLQGLLFGVTSRDPLTLAGVACLLTAVGVAACWIPAARAARVDPAVALRAD